MNVVFFPDLPDWYARLSEEIAGLELRVTPSSTLQHDLNALRVERRRLWMRINGRAICAIGSDDSARFIPGTTVTTFR